MKTKKYLVDLSKDGEGYCCDVEAISPTQIIEHFKKHGYDVVRVELASENHRCKYCGTITAGADEDVLCGECREMFGHYLFSEL